MTCTCTHRRQRSNKRGMPRGVILMSRSNKRGMPRSVILMSRCNKRGMPRGVTSYSYDEV